MCPGLHVYLDIINDCMTCCKEQNKTNKHIQLANTAPGTRMGTHWGFLPLVRQEKKKTVFMTNKSGSQDGNSGETLLVAAAKFSGWRKVGCSDLQQIRAIVESLRSKMGHYVRVREAPTKNLISLPSTLSSAQSTQNNCFFLLKILITVVIMMVVINTIMMNHNDDSGSIHPFTCPVTPEQLFFFFWIFWS